MENQNYTLNVFIASRDRTSLTKKTIESILDNSRVFTTIKISVYDNNSTNIKERMNTFSELLENKKIIYYSYDTPESLEYCFGKPHAFKRWIDTNILNLSVKSSNNNYSTDNEYFAIVDNDMIFGDGWDRCFITANNYFKLNNPNIQYIVKRPGGVWKQTTENDLIKIQNPFSPYEQIEAITWNHGGGSGFWFMNYQQLRLVNWSVNEMKLVHHKHNHDDVISWNRFKQMFGMKDFVAAVKIPATDLDNPLILHLGSIYGSIVNHLVKNEYTRETQEHLKFREEEDLSLTHNELFEKYKSFIHTREW